MPPSAKDRRQAAAAARKKRAVNVNPRVPAKIKQARTRAFLAQATPDASWLARNPGLTRAPLTTVGGPAALDSKLRNEVLAWEQMRRQATLAQKRGQFVGRPVALAAAPRGALGSQLKGFAQEGSAMAVGPSLASYLPGGPKPYFDPKDVALGLVGVFPFGRAGKLLRAGAPATRTLAHAGYSATIPAAGSLIGRGIENLSWAARTGTSKTKKIASEIQRTSKNVSLVKASPGEALRKVGRKLRADQQVALRLVAEGVPIDEQIAYYTKQATAAAVRGDKDSELAHRLHIALIQAARKHLLDLPTGPTLQPSKRVLAQAWGLLEKTSGTREEIAKSLGRLTEEGIAARIQMPGRIVKGAKFYSRGDAKADIRQHITGVRALESDIITAGKGEARELTRSASRVSARGEQFRREAERIGISTAEWDKEIARTFAAGSRARGARIRVADRLERQQAALSRAQDALENAITATRGFTAADIARRIARVNAIRKSLKLTKAEADVLRREGAEVTQWHELAGAMADTELDRMVGSLRRAVIALESARGTSRASREQAGRVLTEAEGAAARIRSQGVKVAQGIRARGGTITGAEGFSGGKVYVPEARGVPGSTVVSPRSVSLQAGAIISGGWRRGITALGRDPSLTHAYKGALKESGLFRTDVTNLSASALAKAIRLDSIKRLRDILLTGARDTPDPAHLDDWVAIKVDPTKDLPGALKSFWDRWESKAGFTGREMERLGDDTAQTLRDALFPNIPPSLEPIANIKWVPKAMVDKIGMLNPFALKFPGSQSIGTRALKGSVDVYNDLERFAILFLNPAYGPVNFLGNTAMNLFQQGAFLPANWIKSVRLMTKMKAENVVALDGVIGRGLTATFSPITAGIKGVTAPVGGAIGTLTDLLPRRAAFFHEARRQGYRTHAEVDALFDAARSGDEVAMGNVDQIARRGNDAIIDYGRQSPVEQHIIGRILFFYPWVKGASRYTYRFPLEHPYQAAGLGYGGYKTKEYAEEKLGEDRPWYTQFDVPLPEGLAEELNKLGVGREGMPLVIGLRQLFPQATAVELAQSVYGFATGSTDMPQLAESLTPAIGNIVTAITGYDTFKQKEVGSGARTFLRQSYETLPPVRFYKGLTEEKSKQALYPRTKTDELIRIGLGGLAPKPFNPETAKRITTGDRGISTAARKRAQFVRDNPDLINPGYLPYAVKYRQMYEGVLAGQRSLAEGLGIKVGDNTYESGDQGLTPKQEYAVKLAVLKQVRPDVLTPELEKNFTAYFKPDSTDPEVAKWSEAFKTWINERLRFKDELGYGIDYLIDKAREKKKQLAG